MFGGGLRAPPTDAVLNRISQEFTYSELAEATGCFSSACRLGEGSYGTVYRGTLRDGTEVAIKALSSPKEGGFREEVEVLSRFRHPNLVILMGFARNGRERYLVYELLPGGDVNARLNKDHTFTWRPRLNVVLDAALGLSHLHGSRPQVFHRDVKTQNILMDKNGTGKVADFGLACLAQANKRSLAVEQTSGTIGYADPLYIRTGVVTEKSEVYSLGTVLLEVLTGRPPALQHPNGRIEYQFEHLNGDIRRLGQMVDRRGQWPPHMVERVGGLALQCTCEQEALRPNFVEIVTRLRQWLRDEPQQAQPAWSPQPQRQPAWTPQPSPQQQQQHHQQHLLAAQQQAAAAAAAAGYPDRRQAYVAQGATPPPWPPQGSPAASPSPAAAAVAAAAAASPADPPYGRRGGSPRQPMAQQAAGQGHGRAASPRRPAATPPSPRKQEQPSTNPFAMHRDASPPARDPQRRVTGLGTPAAAASPQASPAAGQAQAQAKAAAGGAAWPRPAAPVAHQVWGNGWQVFGGVGGGVARRGEERQDEPLLAHRVDPVSAGVEVPSTATRDEDIKKLIDMNIDLQQATEAFRRCSSVEAAVEWCFLNSD